MTIIAEEIATEPYLILVLGWNSTHVRAYIKELMGAGHQVYWVGHQAHEIKGLVGYLDIQYLPGNVQLYENLPVGYRQFSIESLLDLLGGRKMKWDLILHFDDWTITTDQTRLNIPYIYYCSELFYPVVPHVAEYMITPSYAARDLLVRRYKNRFKYCVIPWALRYEMLGISPQFDRKRPVSCSFAGKVHAYKFYKERQAILPFLQEHLEGFEGHWYRPAEGLEAFNPDYKPVPEQGKGQLDGEEYTNMLLRSRFGINFPTPLGPNFRDYEVPGMGGILITRHTKDHDLAGFRDGENCYYFETPDDVLEIVNERYDLEMARRGWQWTHVSNTYHHRYLELINLIQQIA